MPRLVCLALLVALAACAREGGPYPSLAPRAAEAIDPRVPVPETVDTRPVDPALAAGLTELLAQARSGDAAFQAAAATAERLAGAAGGRESESWIAAQQALSVAVAARAPTTRALGDVDAIGARALAERGGLSPADLAALETAGAQVGEIDRRQAARIDAIRGRLGG